MSYHTINLHFVRVTVYSRRHCTHCTLPSLSSLPSSYLYHIGSEYSRVNYTVGLDRAFIAGAVKAR